jgi:hypothetical protein
MAEEIQDNIRENIIIDTFKLKKGSTNRIGLDAYTTVQSTQFNFELKSTTVRNVSTARRLNLSVIKKWRSIYWLIGVFDKNDGETLLHTHFATPSDMKPWLDYWENDIKRGLKISDMLVDKIDFDMVHQIFGKSQTYEHDQLYKVFKRLFSKTQYKEYQNKNGKYDRNVVLEMFKIHNKRYLYNGSYINNPKIPYSLYKGFPKIDKDPKNSLGRLLKNLM